MPHTANKGLSVQAFNTNTDNWGADGTPGDDLNTGVMGRLDTMLGGVSTFTLTNVNVSLDFDASGGGDVQNAMWRITGTLTGNVVMSPAVGNATTYFVGFFYFENLTTGNFSVTVQNAIGSVVLPQGRRGVFFIDSTNGPRIVALVGSAAADVIPAGSRTLFYNASAPSGWTAVTMSDYGMKIVNDGGGGVVVAGTAYSTVFGVSATGSTALTVAQLPAHEHFAFNSGNASVNVDADNYPTLTNTALTGGDQRYIMGGSGATPTLGKTSPTGAGDGHTHSIALQVQTAVFVLATRN